jgi:hypothetical protein
LRKHFFTPDPDYNSADPDDEPTCEICGEAPDAAIHEMDDVPPDEPEFPDDIREPQTVADLFDSAGIRNPPGT